jgi:hypothetical protein
MAAFTVAPLTSRDIESSLMLIAMGEPLSRPEEGPREPEEGANLFRLPQTPRDLLRAFLQVGGSPFDSIRRRSTY